MKHTRIIATLATIGALLSLSQPADAQTFKVGLRDGLSLSWLAGIDDTMPLPSFYAGITGDCFFGERWGVGLDVTLAEQGTHCNENSQGVAIDYSFHYLNIPLLVHHRLPLGSEQHLRFSAGAQMGVFLMGGYDYTAPSVLDDGKVSGSGRFEREAFHPMDFGAVVAVEFGTDNTAIELRYTLGITQTHNGISNTLGGKYYISIPDNRNSVLQIGTVIRF